MKKNALLLLSFIIVALVGCNDDESSSGNAIAVAFTNSSTNITNEETAVSIVFSGAASAAGTLVLDVTATNVEYGTDYTTSPAEIDGTIAVPFSAGATSAQFTFTKLEDALEGEVKNVKLTIASVSIAAEIPPSTNATTLNFNETAVDENTVVAENGGNTIPNQVFIDLSSGTTTSVVRTSWDLGFYSGDDFRVVLNGAINKFAVKKLATTNIDEVQAEDANVTTGNYDASNMAYIDAPYGNLSGTAIAAVSANDADNKVYLVNMGQTISSTAGTGTGVSLTGESRGWKKIRILRSGNDYLLQYADIAATTHNEVSISKNEAYNFTFFSLITNNIVNAEPEKHKWDLNITAFTGETFYGNGDSAGAYYFPDYAITNTKAGIKAIQVSEAVTPYDNFTISDISMANFETVAAGDQRAIGGNWRATYPLQLHTDRYFVIKDPAGNYYKLKFLSMLDSSGQRGKITFEYQLL